MEIKVYLSNLEKFCGTTLVGRWLNLPLSNKYLEREISHVRNGHESFFITDHISLFPIEKFKTLYELNTFLGRFQKFTESNQQRICFLLNVIGCTPEEALKEYRAVAFYPGRTLKGMALSVIHESDIVCQTSSPKKYIDFDKIVNELIFDGFHETESGLFWYF